MQVFPHAAFAPACRRSQAGFLLLKHCRALFRIAEIVQLSIS